MVSVSTFAVLQLFFTFALCTVYNQLTDLKQASFDFVIVGGGTAGAVLAHRLSENKIFQVLVVEAGPTNQGIVASQVPFLWATLQNTPLDWNFTTTPQQALDGRVIPYPRGHVLGGSSTINAQFYTRGSADDYDRWAKVTGDSGWSWSAMLPYFKKHEHWSPPAEPRNTTGQFNPLVHGFNGSTFTSLYGHPQAMDSRTIAAANQLEGGFEFNLDMNSGNPLGTTWFQGTIGQGERSSSATSYLTPDVQNRTNLHVLLNTRTTRLIPSNSSPQGLPAFRNVELFGSGANRSVQATKEVILSSGSIGSPHILMHSGIGDARELQSIGIRPVVNLPSVGKNLTDHPLLNVSFRANTTDVVDNLSTNATLFAEAFNEWLTEKRGPLVNSASNNIIWLRLLENKLSSPDPSAGSHSPHLELIVMNGGSTVESRVTILIAVVSPASRGTLALASSNPLDAPLIDLGMMTSSVDRVVAREGIHSARQFLSARAWDGYVLNEAPPTANASTDGQLDAVIRENTMSVWHPIGTAAMSSRGAAYGVVDPDLKVKNVDGLRVVDASIMPFIVSAHTQTAVYVIAERAADLILQQWI